MYARICAVVLAIAIALPGVAAAQERFGTLTGRVTDQQGAAIPGATVVATNIQTGQVRTFVTDANGQFLAPDLVPGRYTVRFELSGFSPVERTDISVVLGRSFELNTELSVGQLTEAVQVVGEVPLVDQRSTLIAHNVSAEEFDLLPKGRSFQSIAVTAPSVNQGEIEGGLQVNGASGAENAFTVDGIVTNSLINGQSRQNTVFEYLQEVQVKTSGISAEYGGALGGVISAVTKSGGNVFRGEGHLYYEGASLSAAPVKRLVLDPVTELNATYVQDQEQPDRQVEFGGSLGGPIVRDRLFFYGSYSPRNENRSNEYTYTDGTNEIERKIWRQQAFGKLTYSNQRINANWSTLWTPTDATGTLGAYNGTTPNTQNTTRASQLSQIDRGYEVNQVNTSGTVDINLSNNAFLSARGGYFHDRYTETGIPTTTSYTYGAPLNATRPVSAIVPPGLWGPQGQVNTPRTLIVDYDTTKRSAMNVDYNHAFNLGGFHTLKGGYGFQRTVNDINSFYPGGYVNLFWGNSFAFGGQTGTGTYGYYEVHDQRTSNKAGNNIHSLYIQDQWTVGTRVTLNLGLRTEDEKVPTFRPEFLETAFHFTFKDKLAPRLGAAFDVLGDGRVKAFASWGLYYDWTKYELPRGSFGAETWCTYYRGLNTLDIATINLSNMPGNDLWFSNPGGCRDRRVPSFGGDIDPELEPMRQSSTSAGLEFQLNRNATFSVHYIHNDLLETIEDVGFLQPDGSEGYLISNPGKRQAAIQFPTGATPLGQAVPRPKRQYDALEIGYNRRLSDDWFFSANYTLSRLYGNYSGIASSDEVITPTSGVSPQTQQQAGAVARRGGNVNRAWDSDELLFDSNGNLDLLGRLATDRPHVVKLYGAYMLPFGTQIGAFFTGSSGTPMTTYVTSTNSADLMVEGRGDMGRTPVLTRTDLLLSHELPIGGSNKRLRFELNVQNLFNQKTARHLFNFLNKGGIVPDRGSSYIDLSDVDLTQGYDYNALILASPDGANAYDVRYGMEDLFEPGTRGYFTMKFLF